MWLHIVEKLLKRLKKKLNVGLAACRIEASQRGGPLHRPVVMVKLFLEVMGVGGG